MGKILYTYKLQKKASKVYKNYKRYARRLCAYLKERLVLVGKSVRFYRELIFEWEFKRWFEYSHAKLVREEQGLPAQSIGGNFTCAEADNGKAQDMLHIEIFHSPNSTCYESPKPPARLQTHRWLALSWSELTVNFSFRWCSHWLAILPGLFGSGSNWARKLASFPVSNKSYHPCHSPCNTIFMRPG